MSNEEKKEGAFRGIGRAVKEMAPYSGLGLQLAITVVIFWFIGKLIDDHYGTAPLWMIVGATLGIIVGMYNFIKAVLELLKRKEKHDEN
ncbi:Putative F0F1-ATPase subunit Ca2+/Mg2+ transporter [Candidatus Kryptonium thompsonii]|jgi:F0F1-type ATP synthase assembly protein I|uniref:Putative F0F1-ATPase subunit Ca2+/Mg2+ transporter n=1 Tax=Candidatus Kryptonium thompsonii TaxID=1633631 RepID=A0A0P1M9D0_9BACT|nr:AtpZ/AtpI family protein [Candidatus Kryptonium thompsoni]CUS77470.1 Putative F0F1-ATPase subunit Ca2+/Mg2+ transporter [Candidatus Kryptonium thompsoni]CUS78161.1 Putative F0F1-ATPase subunit Ca2+/Mg2+ transporter [Candidatus Kryptonium thompsoni]CUS81025.1 Putative F0F1-ATPase subunit Ca2+/Mg2+ transporter [Candidatus Kryptonium thompsoni]CUS82056.1 Putative F0F1-ATPase subunit Ca2+/Mg2+ transporter [Candidatus Kryptonium thompsoni]CUS86728.1 Putative F0F1-ATPase subunit Ca2+/Mg2+ transpo